MVKGIHILLTYDCNFECDHCFLYCGPHFKGTFTREQLRSLLREVEKIGTISWVYFEGGEPFLYYPLMVEGISMMKDAVSKTGVVTNAYWATTVDDARLWLSPLKTLEISDLSLSDDAFHFAGDDNEAKRAFQAAKELGMPVNTICIDEPTVEKGQDRGEPVIGGGVMLRGRAVETLTEGLPRRKYDSFTECPFEDLEDPQRVHVDCYGNVHICQGVSMGNMWEIPLSELIATYDPLTHPICGPLVEGGPALLAKTYDVVHEDTYVDACHFCYCTRLALVNTFPHYLTPRQVYGLE
jgi:hypothetical protein